MDKNKLLNHHRWWPSKLIKLTLLIICLYLVTNSVSLNSRIATEKEKAVELPTYRDIAKEFYYLDKTTEFKPMHD